MEKNGNYYVDSHGLFRLWQKILSTIVDKIRNGTAHTATELETARTLQTNLGSTTPASFNGSANASIGVTGVLPVANGGTGKSSLELVRVREAVVSDTTERLKVTAGSGVGAITDVDVHIVKALPSDASSHPNRIYLVV